MRRPVMTMALVVGTLVSLAGCASPETANPAPITDCRSGDLPTVSKGKLTVATGEPYSPWYVGDPSHGEGFEAALVQEVADYLGYSPEQISWTRTTFEQMVAPGIKSFDFAAYQASISAARAGAVDFSSPYHQTRQGVLTVSDGPLATVDALADFRGKRIGVTATQTSMDIAQATWGDDVELVPYSNPGDGMQALVAGTVNAMVMDVDQGMSAAQDYFPGTSVVGTLPEPDEPEQYGVVLDHGSVLTPCVSQAIDEMRRDGTLDRLEATWLSSQDVPELS